MIANKAVEGTAPRGRLAVPSPQTFDEWINMKKSSSRPQYPAATLAFYGPTDQYATKAVVGIIPRESDEVRITHKWITVLEDIRADEVIGNEIQAFLIKHGVKSVATIEEIIGCPHEEGKDYPEGMDCPMCPFWSGRDRFTGEMKDK